MKCYLFAFFCFTFCFSLYTMMLIIMILIINEIQFIFITLKCFNKNNLIFRVKNKVQSKIAFQTLFSSLYCFNNSLGCITNSTLYSCSIITFPIPPPPCHPPTTLLFTICQLHHSLFNQLMKHLFFIDNQFNQQMNLKVDFCFITSFRPTFSNHLKSGKIIFFNFFHFDFWLLESKNFLILFLGFRFIFRFFSFLFT